MIYPALPARHDLGFVRVAGAGMGNCLYTYFHAFARARNAGERMIAPAWSSINIGPMLRRERSLRRYGGMFRAHRDEIDGFAKALALAAHAGRFRHVGGALDDLAAPAGGVKVVSLQHYSFAGLAPHRRQIRSRLLEIVRDPPPPPRWGAGGHAAVHIRLGDFLAPSAADLAAVRANMRLPLAWYEEVIRHLRSARPDQPVHLFSDGEEAELAPLLAIPGVTLRREPSDVAELLAMAEARLLVGSNSTFSRWAAFLGDMPSIWFGPQAEQPGDALTPHLALPPDPAGWPALIAGMGL